MGLGPGSVGNSKSMGVSLQGDGSGVDSERDCLEKRNSLRAPVRSVVWRMDFRRVRGLIGGSFVGGSARLSSSGLW